LAISDFYYDSIRLSEFDGGKYMIAYFTTDETPKEGERVIHQSPTFFGREQPYVYTNYEDTLTFTMGIIKNPCVTSKTTISIIEMERLKRWLDRPAPHTFQLSQNSNSPYYGIYWQGTFKVEEELVGSQRIGATITFTSTSPFAFQAKKVYSGTVEKNKSITIKDPSTEIGYIYPIIEIKCLQDGTFEMYNEYDQRHTIVQNCKKNEELTFAKYLQISSSDSTHKLSDDFNYQFLRIGNNYESNVNKITFSLPCEYSFTISPTRKVIPV